MRDEREIKETDTQPAPERDPELAARLRAQRGLPDMAAELVQSERKGRPAEKGELPTVEEAQKILPESPEEPQPRADAVAQERKEEARDRARFTVGKKHLKLVLTLKQDGEAEVVSATEFDGGALLTEAPTSDYIYEVTLRGRIIATEALTQDPFEFHSFGGPTDAELGHYRERAKEATIVVSIPDVTLESAFEDIDVTLYQLEKGPRLERIDAATLGTLKQEKRIRVLGTAYGRNLAPAIRRKAEKRKE